MKKFWAHSGFGYFIVLFFVFLVTLTSVVSAQEVVESESAVEPWKSPVSDREVQVGVLGGLGLIDSTAGLTVVGNLSKKIVHQGFVPDINNQVFIEVQFGPHLYSGDASWFFSTHLRWDFVRDELWTFYALGGLGGNTTSEQLGDRTTVFPRFGVGTFYTFSDMMYVRAELSHELIAAGVSFPF